MFYWVSQEARSQSDNSTGPETQNVPVLVMMILMILSYVDDIGHVVAIYTTQKWHGLSLPKTRAKDRSQQWCGACADPWK